MKNNILLILMTLLGSLASAQTISVSRENARGFLTTDILIKEGQNFYVGGKKLGPKSSKYLSSKWDYLMKSPVKLQKISERKTCAAGTFKIRITESKNRSVSAFKGCSEGESYGLFIAELYNIREKTLKEIR